MQSFFFSPFSVAIVAILMGCLVAVTKTLAMGRVRELEIRERIAMIERGLVPPPESDPRGFERAMSRMEQRRYDGPVGRSGGRQRRVAVILVGIGLGLMVLITAAGDSPREAIGVGGFISILGLAFFVSSLMEPHTSNWNPAAAPPPPVPPSNPPSANATSSNTDLH